MKKLLEIFLLGILTTTLFLQCCSTKRLPVSIDYHAYEYVTKFKEEAEKNGIDGGIINDSIDDVVFYPLDKSFYGLYSPGNRQIVLNYLYHKDSILMKKIIYHELGHLYGLDHDRGGIMKTHQEPLDVHRLYCPLEGGSNLNWEMHKAYLFFKIKQNLEKSK